MVLDLIAMERRWCRKQDHNLFDLVCEYSLIVVLMNIFIRLCVVQILHSIYVYIQNKYNLADIDFTTMLQELQTNRMVSYRMKICTILIFLKYLTDDYVFSRRLSDHQFHTCASCTNDMEAKNAEWAKIFVACLQVFIYFLNSSFTLNKVNSPPMWWAMFYR